MALELKLMLLLLVPLVTVSVAIFRLHTEGLNYSLSQRVLAGIFRNKDCTQEAVTLVGHPLLHTQQNTGHL